METLNIGNEIIQGILHMVVNSGEADYQEKTKKQMEYFAATWFDGNSSAAKKYIEAQLTIEVYNNMDVYCDYDVQEAGNIINNLHSTLTGYLNTVENPLQKNMNEFAARVRNFKVTY